MLEESSINTIHHLVSLDTTQKVEYHSNITCPVHLSHHLPPVTCPPVVHAYRPERDWCFVYQLRDLIQKLESGTCGNNLWESDALGGVNLEVRYSLSTTS